ncbi:MAG: class D beta-lactamase [Thermoanaerobaculia bacterium]|nr:class D beta-lactamase [Thermoanaerobaculia bacterium]
MPGITRIARMAVALALAIPFAPTAAEPLAEPPGNAASPARGGDSGEWRERPDWAALFAPVGGRGTIAVLDGRSSERWVFGAARAGERRLPASTFKIPHLLFVLDAGLARDEFQVFPWDGTRHPIAAWNRDQDLRASLRHSTVWLYQRFARELGSARERAYLERIGYGNADVAGGVDRFWLDGGLAISPLEQVAFLRRLYRNELPFAVEHQRLVKDLMIVEAGRDWILRAKTGWAARLDPQHGWWVGWVERPEGAVFFALNIDLPRGGEDIGQREAIARAVLRSLGALPKEQATP